MNKEIILARKAYFSVGLNNNSGANLCLEVFLKGKLDPATELCVNLTDVDQALKNFIKDVDHKNIEKDLLPVWKKGCESSTEKYAGMDDLQALLTRAGEELKVSLRFDYAQLYELRLHVGQQENLSLRIG